MPHRPGKTAEAEPTANSQEETNYKGRSPAPDLGTPAPPRQSARGQKQALPTVSEEPVPTESLVAAVTVPDIQNPDEFKDLHVVKTENLPDNSDAQSGSTRTNSKPPSQQSTPNLRTSSTSANIKTRATRSEPVPTRSVPTPAPLPKLNPKKRTGTAKKPAKVLDLDDLDDTVYISNNEDMDVDFAAQEDEDSTESDPYAEPEEIVLSDLEEETIQPSSCKKQAAQPGRKPGRPPKTSPPIPIFTINFMTKVNGLVKNFSLDTTSTLADLRDQVAELHKKRHIQLDLSCVTIWSAKSDRLEINTVSEWDFLLQFIIANIGKKKNSLYHVEVFDGIESQQAAKSQKTKKTSQVRDEDGEDASRSGIMGRISNKHWCNEDNYECYIVTNHKYEQYGITVGSHHRIHRPVLVMWANDVINTLKTGAQEDYLPERLISEVLKIKRPLDDVQDGPFSAPPPKQRGMTGSVPAQPLQPPSQVATAQPQLVHASQPGAWPGMPYPPFYYPPMPSPYKQLLAHMTSDRPPSPTRHNELPGSEGARIGQWLEELDEDLDSDDEPYAPLLPNLKLIGVRRVNDLTLFKPEEIEERTGCNIGVAKRLVTKAKIVMRKT